VTPIDRAEAIPTGAWYSLDPACRVRREKFGLLFYDLRGPRLLFAETGASLEPEDLRQGLSADEARRRGEAVPRFLAKLVAKGFLREQSIC
jgi:putative mycofactocin binding protein MftB